MIYTFDKSTGKMEELVDKTPPSSGLMEVLKLWATRQKHAPDIALLRLLILCVTVAALGVTGCTMHANSLETRINIERAKAGQCQQQMFGKEGWIWVKCKD